MALNTLVEYYEKKIIFDKSDLSFNLGKITSPTFYGTKTAYSASVSSGRLNFSKDMDLTNEITLLYEHYYQRLDSNSEIYDIRIQIACAHRPTKSEDSITICITSHMLAWISLPKKAWEMQVIDIPSNDSIAFC